MRPSKSWFLTLVVASGVATWGCHSEPPRRDGADPALAPPAAAGSPHVPDPLDPTSPPVAEPATSGGAWELGLGEAVSIALQHADIVRTVSGGAVFARDTTAYDPAIADTRVEAVDAAFDVALATSMFWTRVDQPPDTTFGPGIPTFTQRDEAAFQASLSKLWISGAHTRLAYNPPLSYLFFSEAGVTGLNPRHAANLEFAISQPLLRGAGPRVNTAAIVIAQLRADQSSWEFKRAVLALVRSVEEAYWDLYAARVALQSLDEVLPLAGEIVRIEQSRLEAQRSIRADLAKARAQLGEFRQQRIAAESSVRAREQALRNLLGRAPRDGRTLVPRDEPPRVEIAIDLSASVAAALENRPDVVRQRLGVHARELERLLADRARLPQLDVQGLWRINGLGQELDSALQLLADNRFTDWQLGITFSRPLGNRQAAANADAAQRQLERDRALLRQTVHAAIHELNDLARDVRAVYLQAEEARGRLADVAVWLEGARLRYEDPPPGGRDWLLQALNEYLLALRAKATAASDAATQLARYNGSLARLEEAKGTLLETRNIALLQDPCTRVRMAQRLDVDIAPLRRPQSQTAPSGSTGPTSGATAALPPAPGARAVLLAPQFDATVGATAATPPRARLLRPEITAKTHSWRTQ